MYCMICKENRAGGDGLCVKCRFKMNTQNREAAGTDIEITLPEGRYVGHAKNGIPDGRGELTYNEHDSRKSYKGDFRNGMRHGKGKLIFRNEAYYDGDWVNDKYDGYGEESLPGGNNLEGYYSAGHLTSGHVYFGDGREYDGEWSDDMPNGNGKMYYTDGHAEEGYWVNGVCAFSEAPTEEQIAQFLAEQEQRALAENPLEEEADYIRRQQNTTAIPDEDINDRIWNPLAREELAAVEDEEEAPLLFAGMEAPPNVTKVSSQRVEPVAISPSRTTMRSNGFDNPELSLEEEADELAKRMAEATAQTLVKIDESVADVDITGGAGDGVNKEGGSAMIESSFVEDTSEDRKDNANSAILKGMYQSIGKPIPEEEREKVVVEPKISEKALEDRAMQDVLARLGMKIPTVEENAEEKPEEAAAEAAPEAPAAAAVPATPEKKPYDPVTKTGYHEETYANGEHYAGEFVNGKRHGIGRMEYANGDVYEGCYDMGKRHGQGIMTYAAGSRYEGNWENSIKSGQGRFTQANGEVYEGNFENGTFDGTGSYQFKNGNMYIGDWKAGRREGKGVLIHADGTKEAQIWENGKKIFSEAVVEPVKAEEPAPEAEAAAAVNEVASNVEAAADAAAQTVEAAAVTASQTVEAAAEVKETVAEAAAEVKETAAEAAAEAVPEVKPAEIRTINFKSGNRYEGEVDEAGKPHGKGVFTYTNGGYYDGEFEHGVRCGIGTFVWSTGDRYEGGWKDDKRHGEGVMKYANGRTRRGRFENNEYVGI